MTWQIERYQSLGLWGSWAQHPCVASTGGLAPKGLLILVPDYGSTHCSSRGGGGSAAWRCCALSLRGTRGRVMVLAVPAFGVSLFVLPRIAWVALMVFDLLEAAFSDPSLQFVHTVFQCLQVLQLHAGWYQRGSCGMHSWWA